MTHSMKRIQYKSALLVSCLSLSLAGCGTPFDTSVMPEGFTTNKEKADESFLAMPSGYKITKYHNKKVPESDLRKHQGLALENVQASALGWSQVAFDLALAIDEKIGLDTKDISLKTQGSQTNLARSLDHYLRENLRDLDFEILTAEKTDYHLSVYVRPLEHRRKLTSVSENEMAGSPMGQLNEGGETVVYTAEPKQSQDIQIDTVIKKGDQVINQTRSAHLLTLQPADKGS